ncbi:thermonuclease family protein [Cyanobacterium aponinum AL20118]|uniref:Thermonuclease family protein n=1 Tax=Cyanobacterium aponinum AL20115 TaxID=3090662 RepID=A0AAF1C096_9CHRO|nr:thermonuclease family protein [Cyanobacterium aponinum]WPF87352.1 thermonuclease family protein [Cyanobacterium aponinum AL20115]
MMINPLFLPFILIFFYFFIGLTGNREQRTGNSVLQGNGQQGTGNSVNIYSNYTVIPDSIYDGDTFRVFKNNTQLKIRFACVDAPEKAQPLGIQSRDYLRSLLQKYNYQVSLNITETDRYGRSVAEVYLPNGQLVQELQVKVGMVYPYERYKDDCPTWGKVKKAGVVAKRNRIGVWAGNYEKPWDYRRKK